MNRTLIVPVALIVLTACAPAARPDTVVADLLRQVHVVDTITTQPGYDRSCKSGHDCVFGPAWNDPTDHSGCDTRNRVLAAQLTNPVLAANGCTVESGTLADPYTGTAMPYTRADHGHTIQIDHIIPLKLAWDAGANAWTSAQRQAFANDPVELLAVSAAQNEAKSDSGVARWLPPNTAFDCTYITDYLKVAVKYSLPITTADRDTAAAHCP
ncbi:HNH endonuclease family protein [Mycolicibacterium sphagni]|uniref:HNH endonuclease family protein n=1 Tax=Mycolicibacterium sphagni TaxID=1786 RepID=UPI0021F39286|nr:HNH endonuclease family protein [Mycolicibacterium sphagni]MCV7174898.1 HNH endonuclease [Mycolicibacterium sphagni]